jgi:hypothetical protein
MHLSVPCIVSSLLLASLPAQLALTDGNMNVVVGPLSATSQAPRGLQLRSDAIAINQGYEHWWYYRVAGDTREFSLRNLGGVTSGVVSQNDHADIDFADVDARGILKASLDFDLYDSGPASGVFISRLTVMNTSAVAQTIDLFCYTDVDVGGTFADDQCTGTANRHFVTDATGVQIEIRAVGADRSDVGAFPAVRNLLTNAVLNDLPNNLPQFNGDYTGAFQWQSRTLQPFEQRSFQVVIAVDTAAAQVPAVEHYGAGNGSGFEIHTQQLPLQDNTQARTFGVAMKNALPNTEYRIATGLAPDSATPFIPGIDMWVDPFSLVAIYAGFTNAQGAADVQFTIPPSPYLTGFSAYHQVFAVDAAAPNGFAFFSPGLRTRIGKL